MVTKTVTALARRRAPRPRPRRPGRGAGPPPRPLDPAGTALRARLRQAVPRPRHPGARRLRLRLPAVSGDADRIGTSSYPRLSAIRIAFRTAIMVDSESLPM